MLHIWKNHFMIWEDIALLIYHLLYPLLQSTYFDITEGVITMCKAIKIHNYKMYSNFSKNCVVINGT